MVHIAIRHLRGQRFRRDWQTAVKQRWCGWRLEYVLSLVTDDGSTELRSLTNGYVVGHLISHMPAVQFQLDSDASTLCMQRGALLRSRILLSLKILLSSNRSNILKFSCEKQKKKVSQFHLLLKNKSPTPVSKSPQLL